MTAFKNNRVRVSKTIGLEMAHALPGYDGPCRNIHGHSYKLTVTVSGIPLDDNSHAKNGMVIDFSELKNILKTSIVDVFDHALILKDDVNMKNSITSLSDKIIFVKYTPTCENLLLDFVRVISEKLPSRITLFSVKLAETDSSCSEWFAGDN